VGKFNCSVDVILCGDLLWGGGSVKECLNGGVQIVEEFGLVNPSGTSFSSLGELVQVLCGKFKGFHIVGQCGLDVVCSSILDCFGSDHVKGFDRRHSSLEEGHNDVVSEAIRRVLTVTVVLGCDVEEVEDMSMVGSIPFAVVCARGSEISQPFT
jgi:hypothetical protein